MADGPLFLSALVFGALHVAAVMASWDRLPTALAISYVACSASSAANHGATNRATRALDRAAVLAGIALDAADAGGWVPPPWTAAAAALYVASKAVSGRPPLRTALHVLAHACATRGHLDRSLATRV